MKKHLKWLYGELPELVKTGVLSETCAGAILDHYGEVKERSGRSIALTICSILGAVLIGAGIILLFGHNWSDLSRQVRTVLAILPLVVAQFGGGWCLAKGKSSVAWRESVSTFIMLMLGSSIALIGQTYHVPGNLTQFLFVWMVLSIPLVYIFRAVLPCLLYLAGITGWAGSSQYDGGHSLLFWVLYAGVLPFVWTTMRRDRFSIPSGILGWGICLQATWVGLALERAMPGLWIVVYLSLFATLYLAGAYWFDDAPSGWQKPMQIVGAAGIVILTLMLTYEWPWNDVGWRHWHYGYRYHVHAAWVDYVLALLVPCSTVVLMATAVRRQQVWRLSYGVAALVGVVGFLIAAATPYEMACVLLANGYALVLGLATVAYGLRNGLIGTINGGMAIISSLILLRFFDEDFSFFARGCAFIVLGVGFLVTNLILVRRMRKEVQS
jgi:uncharacterized membrane protein